MSEYPEHEKLHLVKDKAQVIGEFIEWAEDQKWFLQKWSEAGKYHYGASGAMLTDLLGEFFGIDTKKLEEEKRAMLVALEEDAP